MMDRQKLRDRLRTSHNNTVLLEQRVGVKNASQLRAQTSLNNGPMQSQYSTGYNQSLGSTDRMPEDFSPKSSLGGAAQKENPFIKVKNIPGKQGEVHQTVSFN